MGVPAGVVIALVAAICVLAVALVALTVVVLKAAGELHKGAVAIGAEQRAKDRDQDRELVLGVVERIRPQAAVEQAQAEAIRGAAEAETEAVAKVDSAIAEARQKYSMQIRSQEERGYSGIVAEGRAVMVAAGFDPDNPEDTDKWNAQAGAVS